MRVSEPVDASQVRCSGAGLGPTVRARLPHSVNVDCSAAGRAALDVTLLGPTGALWGPIGGYGVMGVLWGSYRAALNVTLLGPTGVLWGPIGAYGGSYGVMRVLWGYGGVLWGGPIVHHSTPLTPHCPIVPHSAPQRPIVPHCTPLTPPCPIVPH